MRRLAIGWLLALGACASSRPGFAPTDASDDTPGADSADEAAEGAADQGAPNPFEGGMLVCGGTTCDLTTQYCLHYLPDGGLTPDAGTLSDKCTPIPSSCQATPTCMCIESAAPCGSALTGCVQAAGVDVTCTPP